MKRVCVANSVGMQSFLNRGDQEFLFDRVEWRYHDYYPVVVVKE